MHNQCYQHHEPSFRAEKNSVLTFAIMASAYPLQPSTGMFSVFRAKLFPICFEIRLISKQNF